MAFDIINGVAHFKFFYKKNSGSSFYNDTELKNNIITKLAEYLPLWSKDNENKYLYPSWTSSGGVQFYVPSAQYGIYIVLFSAGKTGNNYTYLKDSNRKWDYSERYASAAAPFNWTMTSSSWDYCYLNVIKSKTGRSFAFSLSHTPSNQMQCLIAEDETGNIALFQTMGASGAFSDIGAYFSSYLYLARDEKNLANCINGSNKYGAAHSSMQGSFLCLDPIIKPNIKTSLVRTPNLLGNNLFKEVYSITSTSIPLNELDDVVFIIDGHKYKTISGYSLARNGSDTATATKCAGPFALEIE